MDPDALFSKEPELGEMEESMDSIEKTTGVSGINVSETLISEDNPQSETNDPENKFSDNIPVLMADNASASGFYIPRSISIADLLDHKVLLHTEPPMTFAISGMLHDELQDLLPRGRVAHTMDTKKESSGTGSEIIVINTKQDFLKLSESRDNVHWLHNQGNVFKWKFSKGDTSVLQKYICSKTTLFKDLDSILDVPRRVVVLSGDPGMGNSSLLSHLAEGTKKENPYLCIIVVNLNKVWESVNEVPDVVEMGAVVKWLIKMSGISTEMESLLECKLKTMEHVCLLFDGFENLDSKYDEKVCTLFKMLLHTKLRKLWIVSGETKKAKLEKELFTLAFTLQPLSEVDQNNFLSIFWKKCVPDIKEITLHKFVEEVTLQISRCLTKDWGFSCVPAQLIILAVALEDTLRHYNESEYNMNLPVKLNLLYIYETFVDRKLRAYEMTSGNKSPSDSLTHYDELKETFLKNYIKISFLSFMKISEIRKLVDSEPNIPKLKLFVSKLEKVNTEMTIIREFVNKKPIFVDNTFVQYFSAVYFARNYKRGTDYLREKLLDPRFKNMWNFLNRIQCRKYDLHMAVINHDIKSVENLLFERKLDVNEKDLGGRTALHLAVMGCLIENGSTIMQGIIRILLEFGADPSIEDKVLKWRPLRLADKIRTSPVILGLLLERHQEYGDLVETKQRIRNDDYIQEVLGVVAKRGFIQLLIFMMKCGVRLGHDLTVKYEGGKSKATLLHEASRCGQLRLVKFLLENKVYINVTDSKCERTPLMWAAEAGELLIISTLTQRGASLNARDRNGSTALLRATENGKIDVVKLLVQREANVELCDKFSDNILHHAVKSRNLELVTYILNVVQNCGMRMDSVNHVLETPLWWAAQTGQATVVEMLVQRSASMQMRDSVCGYTPLHVAAREGHLKVVQYLVLYGANLTSRDEFGRTPLQVAEWNRKSEVAELLQHAQRYRRKTMA